MKFFALAFLLCVFVFMVGCAAPTDAGPILESQGKPIPATAEEAKIIGEGGKLPAADETTTPEPAPSKPAEPAGEKKQQAEPPE